MDVLLTGFEPFGDLAVNPSWEVAAALDGACIGAARVVARRLPCEFGRVQAVLADALDERPYGLVVALGVALRRSAVSIERVAINVDDARIPDNAGNQPVDTPVVARAPAAYFSTLPIKRIAAALRAADVAAEISQSAGTYVCNHVFFALAHRLAQRGRAARGGFIHLPPLPGMPGSGAPMALVTQIEAIRIALDVALGASHDLITPGGALD